MGLKKVMNENESYYLAVIYECVNIINSDLPDTLMLPLQPNSVLVGEGGVYDSLSIINLLVAIEESLNNLGEEVMLLDEDLVTDAEGPYSTLYKLAAYIESLS